MQDFRASTSHKSHREHGKAPKQLLGVAMRQQLRMPIVLAAAVSPNRCCLPPNATSPTPQTHRNTSQIRNARCGACVALQAIPYSAYSSGGREEKDRFQGQEPQVPSVLILQGISQLLPPYHPHGECGQAQCTGKSTREG